jgi:hypothetical protein
VAPHRRPLGTFSPEASSSPRHRDGKLSLLESRAVTAQKAGIPPTHQTCVQKVVTSPQKKKAKQNIESTYCFFRHLSPPATSTPRHRNIKFSCSFSPEGHVDRPREELFCLVTSFSSPITGNDFFLQVKSSTSTPVV